MKVTIYVKQKKLVFLMLNEMKTIQFLTNFVLIDRIILLSQITKRGPRATKRSWRAALWPCLVYTNRMDRFTNIDRDKLIVLRLSYDNTVIY